MTRRMWVCIVLLLIFPYICGQRQRIFKQYNKNKSWREAQSICRQKHTDLITIRNKEESQALFHYEGWLGLYQVNNTSPWKWSFEDEIGTYFNWFSEERDLNQNCSYKRPSTTKWEDDECSFARSFICHDETLVLVNKNKTWEEALEHCRSLKGESYDLATLITLDDHNYARERAQKATTDEVWTGLRYLGDEWLWVGGEQVLYQDIPSCLTLRCGILGKNNYASFGIRDCNQKRNFFCYKKPGSY